MTLDLDSSLSKSALAYDFKIWLYLHIVRRVAYETVTENTQAKQVKNWCVLNHYKASVLQAL